MMAPHQKERTTGKLLLECISEIERLERELAQTRRYCGCLEDHCDVIALRLAQLDAGCDAPNK